MYKLYPFYIIIYDIGISFTFTRTRVHPLLQRIAQPGQDCGSELLPRSFLCRVLDIMQAVMVEASSPEGDIIRMQGTIPRNLLRRHQLGSIIFDILHHVFDSVDVLPSTRSEEIVAGGSEGVWTDNMDVMGGPSDVK